MKKIAIISSIILGCNLSSFAQLTESSYIAGVSSSFFLTSPSNGSADNVMFSISPQIGKFVSEKWLVNGGLGYAMRIQKSNFGSGTGTNSTHNFSGQFGMTRFYPLSEKMYFTLDYSAGMGYELTNNQYMNDSTVIDSRSTAINLGIACSPGLAYFINKKWMIYSNLGALRYGYNYGIESNSGRHTLSYDLRANPFGIGARYIFDSM